MVATSQIREHMEVLGSDGAHIGTVDHLEGEDRIKLTKSDSPDGMHHFIPVDWVDHVDAHVHLSKASDEVMDEWEDEDSMELEGTGNGAQMTGSLDQESDEAESEEEKDEWAEERR
jgi:hypothetical protein